MLDHLFLAMLAIAVVVVVTLALSLALAAAVGAAAFVVSAVGVALGAIFVDVIAVVVALRVDNVAVLGVVRPDGAVVAGMIADISPEATGLSKLMFDPSPDLLAPQRLHVPLAQLHLTPSPHVTIARTKPTQRSNNSSTHSDAFLARALPGPTEFVWAEFGPIFEFDHRLPGHLFNNCRTTLREVLNNFRSLPVLFGMCG